MYIAKCTNNKKHFEFHSKSIKYFSDCNTFYKKECSIFINIFGKNGNSTVTENTVTENFAGTTEQELPERFGGIALEKQNHFGEIIGNNNWNFDMGAGEISFGENLIFPKLILGTFSHSSETWLRAWANTGSGIPENLMRETLQLKNYGEKNDIDLLKINQFETTKDDLHKIGMIASGMFGASGYYLANYGQGTMCMTVKSEEIDKTFQSSQQKILTTFSQLISIYEMNHKNALKNYLLLNNYEISENAIILTGTKNGQTIKAEFGELSRPAKLNG